MKSSRLGTKTGEESNGANLVLQKIFLQISNGANWENMSSLCHAAYATTKVLDLLLLTNLKDLTSVGIILMAYDK